MCAVKVFFNLLDSTMNTRINQQARSYSNSLEAYIYTKADAILVKNSVHKTMGNAYMSFYNSDKPFKMFTDLKS
jgi:hypothetical protein